jgi:hypothetical protein
MTDVATMVMEDRERRRLVGTDCHLRFAAEMCDESEVIYPLQVEPPVLVSHVRLGLLNEMYCACVFARQLFISLCHGLSPSLGSHAERYSELLHVET